MTWLAVDTATGNASIALGTGAADAVEESIAGARAHARTLIPAVERLLSRAGRTLADVQGVVVGDGPGSFTGLRVAAAFAKALVDSRRVRLHAAPSLMARAASVATEGMAVLAVADALRGEHYAGLYRFGSAQAIVIEPAAVMDAAGLSALARRADALAGDLPEAVSVGGLQWLGPAPANAAWLLELLRCDGGTVAVTDVETWEPVYGRPAEAQARWERDHGRALPGAAGPPG